MMSIWVTGSAGQLGAELRDRSSQAEAQFYFTRKQNVDLTDFKAVEAFILQKNINTIINCAAFTAVDAAEAQQEAALKLNFEAVRHLGELCKCHGVRLVHISTDYVFDGTAHRPYPTHAPCKPVNFYGTSKRQGEESLLDLNLSNSMILRTSWLYAAHGSNFVKTMLQLGAEKAQVSVVADQVGSPTYAGDLADFILENLIDFKSETTEVYHYSNSGICSWYDLAVAVMELSGTDCSVSPIPATAYPTAAARPYYSVLDTGRLKQDFQLRLPYWRTSLATCISKLQTAV